MKQQEGGVLNILVADDSLPSLLACKALLSKMGHRVEGVQSAEQAYALACAQSFDVIFLDECMPDARGSEIARRLRGRPGFSGRTRIFALTGVARAELDAQAIDGVLDKPVTTSALNAALGAEGEPCMDDAVLALMAEDLGPEGVKKLLGIFASELRDLGERLAQGIAADDGQAIIKVAHIWKNSAALYGAMPLADLAAEINDGGARVDSKFFEKARALQELGRQTLDEINSRLAES